MIDLIDFIDNYLGRNDLSDNVVKTNSNQSRSVGQLANAIYGKIFEDYWNRIVYTEDLLELEKNNLLRIHNSGYLSSYCAGWDLHDFLRLGIPSIGNAPSIEPPKYFEDGLNMIYQVLMLLRLEHDGAQAISSFDTYLAPFVRSEKLTYECVKRSLKRFVQLVNTPLDKGSQVPFLNLTMDIFPSGKIAQYQPILGGEYIEGKLSDYDEERLLINRALLEVLEEGDNKGRTYLFPIITYNITDNFDWDNPNLDALWKITGKYGLPYFCNFTNSGMEPDDIRSMCCRLRIDNTEIHRRGGALFGANPLTGSVGIFTINLPRLGIELRNIGIIKSKLKEILATIFENLDKRRDFLESLMSKGVFPYSQFYMQDIYRKTGKYYTNHFSTVGILGMHEMLSYSIGVGLDSDQGRLIAKEIMEFINEIIKEHQVETGILYNLEATPGESTAYFFAKRDAEYIDKNNLNKQFATKSYYTNSTYLPFNNNLDIWELIDSQVDLQNLYSGGTVLHLFTNSNSASSSAIKNLVKKVASYKLPYFSITPTYSVCDKHGYVEGEDCIICKTKGESNNIVKYSRVVGYYSRVDNWNKGKVDELKDRTILDI